MSSVASFGPVVLVFTGSSDGIRMYTVAGGKNLGSNMRRLTFDPVTMDCSLPPTRPNFGRAIFVGETVVQVGYSTDRGVMARRKGPLLTPAPPPLLPLLRFTYAPPPVPAGFLDPIAGKWASIYDGMGNDYGPVTLSYAGNNRADQGSRERSYHILGGSITRAVMRLLTYDTLTGMCRWESVRGSMPVVLNYRGVAVRIGNSEEYDEPRLVRTTRAAGGADTAAAAAVAAAVAGAVSATPAEYVDPIVGSWHSLKYNGNEFGPASIVGVGSRDGHNIYSAVGPSPWKELRVNVSTLACNFPGLQAADVGEFVWVDGLATLLVPYPGQQSVGLLVEMSRFPPAPAPAAPRPTLAPPLRFGPLAPSKMSISGVDPVAGDWNGYYWNMQNMGAVTLSLVGVSDSGGGLRTYSVASRGQGGLFNDSFRSLTYNPASSLFSLPLRDDYNIANGILNTDGIITQVGTPNGTRLFLHGRAAKPTPAAPAVYADPVVGLWMEFRLGGIDLGPVNIVAVGSLPSKSNLYYLLNLVTHREMRDMLVDTTTLSCSFPDAGLTDVGTLDIVDWRATKLQGTGSVTLRRERNSVGITPAPTLAPPLGITPAPALGPPLRITPPTPPPGSIDPMAGDWTVFSYGGAGMGPMTLSFAGISGTLRTYNIVGGGFDSHPDLQSITFDSLTLQCSLPLRGAMNFARATLNSAGRAVTVGAAGATGIYLIRGSDGNNGTSNAAPAAPYADPIVGVWRSFKSDGTEFGPVVVAVLGSLNNSNLYRISAT